MTKIKIYPDDPLWNRSTWTKVISVLHAEWREIIGETRWSKVSTRNFRYEMGQYISWVEKRYDIKVTKSTALDWLEIEIGEEDLILILLKAEHG